MLIKAIGPLKICICIADMLLDINYLNKMNKQKGKRKRGLSLKLFFLKETQSYEYTFCIVCKDRI